MERRKMGLLNEARKILETAVNQAQKKRASKKPSKYFTSLPRIPTVSLFLAGAATLVPFVEFLNPASSIHKQLLPCVEGVRG